MKHSNTLGNHNDDIFFYRLWPCDTQFCTEDEPMCYPNLIAHKHTLPKLLFIMEHNSEIGRSFPNWGFLLAESSICYSRIHQFGAEDGLENGKVYKWNFLEAKKAEVMMVVDDVI